MNPIIEFCISNLATGTQVVMQQLERDPNVDVVEYGCLGYCGICSLDHFCLVDGETVVGETPEELLRKDLFKNRRKRTLKKSPCLR